MRFVCATLSKRSTNKRTQIRRQRATSLRLLLKKEMSQRRKPPPSSEDLISPEIAGTSKSQSMKERTKIRQAPQSRPPNRGRLPGNTKRKGKTPLIAPGRTEIISKLPVSKRSKAMLKLLKRFPSATDRDFYYYNQTCKSEFEIYIRLRIKNKVRNPDEFKYVHLKRIRDMCNLMRWFRRSLNRSGVPYKNLPGNSYLTIHPGTAMRWIFDLSRSKRYRANWIRINQPKWLRLIIQNRKHSSRAGQCQALTNK